MGMEDSGWGAEDKERAEAKEMAVVEEMVGEVREEQKEGVDRGEVVMVEGEWVEEVKVVAEVEVERWGGWGADK